MDFGNLLEHCVAGGQQLNAFLLHGGRHKGILDAEPRGEPDHVTPGDHVRCQRHDGDAHLLDFIRVDEKLVQEFQNVGRVVELPGHMRRLHQALSDRLHQHKAVKNLQGDVNGGDSFQETLFATFEKIAALPAGAGKMVDEDIGMDEDSGTGFDFREFHGGCALA